MDHKTLNSYNQDAKRYTADWLDQPTPEEIHTVVKTYFTPHEASADIGSGSGRDVAWMNANGYPCLGFDASEGLLEEAQRCFPQHSFQKSTLPTLKEIEDQSFTNILCETVLMHLPKEQHLLSLENLLRILRPAGVVSLSWRLSQNPNGHREQDGRLYEPVDMQALVQWAESKGAIKLHSSRITSPSSGKIIEQLVLREKS